jgi:hypothetical protein
VAGIRALDPVDSTMQRQFAAFPSIPQHSPATSQPNYWLQILHSDADLHQFQRGGWLAHSRG